MCTMSQQDEKIEVFVEGEGLAAMLLIEIDPNETVEVILTRAKEHGAIIEEDTIVLVEGRAEPIERSRSAHEVGIHKHHRIHVHRCKEVKVKFTYNGDSQSYEFKANETVATVRTWALNHFPIDAALKVNMILRFCGTTSEPDLERHIGTYAKHGACEVCFDLVLDPRVQG